MKSMAINNIKSVNIHGCTVYNHVSCVLLMTQITTIITGFCNGICTHLVIDCWMNWVE